MAKKSSLINCLGVSLIVLASIRAHGDYADSLWLGYQEGLTNSGNLILTDLKVEQTALHTYYAGLVWNNGYMGVQRGDYFPKHVHFSVWDSSSNSPTELIWKGSDVVARRFGGEGTGWQAAWPFDWQEGTVYRLCVTLSHTNACTDYSAHFFDPVAGRWKRIATFRFRDVWSFGYVASFIEDFGNSSEHPRSVSYGNGWLRTYSNTWVELRTAAYGGGQFQTNKNGNVVENMFRLSTGGNTISNVPFNTMLMRDRESATSENKLVIGMNQNLVRLRWQSLPDVDYQLDWTTNLHIWSSSQRFAAVSNSWLEPRGLTSSRFYRLSATSPSIGVEKQTILANGSFELPGFDGMPYFRYLGNGDTNSLLGWTVINDGAGEPPYLHKAPGYGTIDQSYSLMLNQGSGLQTALPVTSGVTYELSFFAFVSGNQPVSPLSVSFAGFSTIVLNPQGLQTIRFTSATNTGSALLQFFNNSPAGDYRTYQLDLISVVPVDN